MKKGACVFSSLSSRIAAFARQILANYQARTADKRLSSQQPGPLKTQAQATPIPACNTLITAAALPTGVAAADQRKGHKRALVPDSDLPSSSSDSDPIVFRQPKRTKPNPLPPSSIGQRSLGIPIIHRKAHLNVLPLHIKAHHNALQESSNPKDAPSRLIFQEAYLGKSSSQHSIKHALHVAYVNATSHTTTRH